MKIYKIYHKPTGLYYCSVKGRFKEDKTNLSVKGEFYTSVQMVKKVFKEYSESIRINKAQCERFKLPPITSHWSYSKALKEELVIHEYSVEFIQEVRD